MKWSAIPTGWVRSRSMKLRESGMPEAAYRETLFDVPLILNRFA